MKKQTARRLVFVLSAWLLFGGLVCLSQAQVSQTGGGKGNPGAASCSFPSLTGLLGNYRADTGVTGNPITAVVNQANPGTFNLANSGTVPFTASSAYNSKNAFGFATANDAALVATSFGIGIGSDVSVFVVGRMASTTAAFGGAVVYGVGGGNDFNTSGAGAFLTRDNTNANISSAESGSGTLNGAMSTDANHRFGLVFDLVALTKTLYVDNVQVGQDTPNNIVLVDAGTLVIGNRYLSGAAGGAGWDGPILQVVVANAAFTLTERNNLDTFFTCQWGT